MEHKVPRPNFGSYSAARSITVWRIEDNFGDSGATDASAFAAGEEEMLIKFTIENDLRASERISKQVVSASCCKVWKGLFGRGARRKNPTSGAHNA